METLEALDRSLFLFINGLRASWLDMPMWYISTTILWTPLFVFFLYYAFKQGKLKQMAWLVLGCAICIALTDLISVQLFKNTIQRYRPTHNLEIMDLVQTVIKPNGEEYRGGLYGFISSHAANYFGMATFIFFLFKSYSKWWMMLFLWAAIVAYSRIYLGVHYPGDILGGALLGITVGYSVYRISKRWGNNTVKN
ncbi:MAG: phosphatase PAP2 family protein [Crocinitomicaceae bacterium]|nr:phosphatase PAP2 family protein [Crocinitomicaceae bacterium]